MKEKMEKYKEALIIAGGIVIASAAALIANQCGYKCGWHKGFQKGCDCLFLAMAKEFPDHDYSEFLTKYTK